MHRLVTAFLMVVCCTTIAKADKAPIDLAKAAYPSPDGNFILTFRQGEGGDGELAWLYFDVKSSRSGKVVGSADLELFPVFSVRWTGDCQSLVIVGHVAHGSLATLYHVASGEWSFKTIYPSDFADDRHFDRIVYDVVAVQPREHEVELTYELETQVWSEMDRNLPQARYLVTLTADPSTNQIRSSKRKQIK